MKIMDLLASRDRRSLEEGQSDMAKGTRLGSPGCEILSIYKGEVRTRSAEGNAIPFVVGSHSVEIIAPRYLALEMIDIGRLHSRSRRLVVTPVLVQPRNRKRIGTPIKWKAFRNRRIFLSSRGSGKH